MTDMDDRNWLTECVLTRLKPYRPRYRGGSARLLSDFLISWGVPVGKDHLENIASLVRRERRAATVTRRPRKRTETPHHATGGPETPNGTAPPEIVPPASP